MASLSASIKDAGNTQSAAGWSAPALRPAAADDLSSLGIYAKKHSPPGNTGLAGRKTDDFDHETGELLPEKPGLSPSAARAERWALKAVANRLLPADHKTTKCHRYRIPKKQIQVMKGAGDGRAFYQGLQVCSSVWACPICASKITERRKVELQGGTAVAQAMGLSVYLLTLTVPHGLGDDVTEILGKMTAAWAKLNQGKAGMQLRERLGLRGTVRALEVTHGKNGFHPHFHALLFLDGRLSPDQVNQIINPRWQAVAQLAGLPKPSTEHGCRVDGGEKAAAYIAKGSGWGLEAEMTKGHLKRGKGDSRTPMDLLRDHENGDKHAGALFNVYAKAFHGRRQLVWSKGLKALLAVVDLTDEEISESPDEEAALRLSTISDWQWKCIRAIRCESVVLDLAEVSKDALVCFLRQLPKRNQVQRC